MKIDIYAQSGEKKGTMELPKEIFEIEFNEDLVHQMLIRQLANKRASTAHTKKRGEVRGGGKKPLPQKHTGNARQGSIRSPHMRGGGIVFGPRNTKNYKKDMPKKQRRKALFCALSEKARNNEIFALEGYKSDSPKTKPFAEMLSKLPIEKDVLIVIPEKNEIVQKSTSNIPFAKTILARYINIHDLQRFQKVILFKDAVEILKQTFLTKKSK